MPDPKIENGLKALLALNIKIRNLQAAALGRARIALLTGSAEDRRRAADEVRETLKDIGGDPGAVVATWVICERCDWWGDDERMLTRCPNCGDGLVVVNAHQREAMTIDDPPTTA